MLLQRDRCQRPSLPLRGLRQSHLGRVKPSILAQDRGLETLQRRRRLDPELVEQGTAAGAIGVERLALAARPVEGEHQLAPETLAVRVLRDQRANLRDQTVVTAQCELGVDPFLDREQTQLVEAENGGLRERLVGEVGQGRAPPECERVR